MSDSSSNLPKGSLVLVTGLTGFIASHIGKQLFDHGFKVRGTVRDLAKAAWLKDDLFKAQHLAGDLELVQVPDLGAPNAFDEAVKGVVAVAHVATIVSLDPNPHNVVPQTVEGAVSLLRAAKAEPSIRRVVYTTSSGTSSMPVAGVKLHVERDTWNDGVLEAAWAPPPYDPSRALVSYMASKVEAEKAVWRFVEEEKPGFTVNAVSPFTTLGAALNSSHVRGTVGWVSNLWKGDTSHVALLPASIYVSVRDVAALHVAAIVDQRLVNERIQAWGLRFNWNDVLAIFRRISPDRKFVNDFEGLGELEITTDETLALRLLKEWAGQDGWTSLEDGIRETVESLP